MTITGGVATSATFKQTAGGHSMTIAGAVTEVLRFPVNVGGYLMSIVGTLTTDPESQPDPGIGGSRFGLYLHKMFWRWGYKGSKDNINL